MSTWDSLTNKQLEALPTHRLYKVYQLFQSLDAWLHHESGYNDNNSKRLNGVEQKRLFIKAELDTRGHLERPIPEIKPKSKKALARQAQKWSFWWRKPVESEKPCLIQDPEACIGKQVFKISRKPFKSKNFYNTVKAISVNPHTGKKAFTFEEDAAIVNVDCCDARKVK